MKTMSKYEKDLLVVEPFFYTIQKLIKVVLDLEKRIDELEKEKIKP